MSVHPKTDEPSQTGPRTITRWWISRSVGHIYKEPSHGELECRNGAPRRIVPPQNFGYARKTAMTARHMRLSISTTCLSRTMGSTSMPRTLLASAGSW